MLDCLGNKVKEGDYVRWNIPDALQCKLVFKVTRISEGGIETPDGLTPPMLQLTIMLPVNPTQPGQETILSDFLCAQDPQSEALLDKLASGPRQ